MSLKSLPLCLPGLLIGTESLSAGYRLHPSPWNEKKRLGEGRGRGPVCVPSVSGAAQRPAFVGLRTWEIHPLPAAAPAEAGEAELARTRAPRTRGERSDRASQASRS